MDSKQKQQQNKIHISWFIDDRNLVALFFIDFLNAGVNKNGINCPFSKF